MTPKLGVGERKHVNIALAAPLGPVVSVLVAGVQLLDVNIRFTPDIGTVPSCRLRVAVTMTSFPGVTDHTHSAARLGGAGSVVDGSVVDGSVVDGSVVDGSVVDEGVCPDCETVTNAVAVPPGP